MTPARLQQIQDLYHDVLERTPEEREAFLNQACNGDVELRCEVESLLANSGSEVEVLRRPALSLLAEDLSDRVSVGVSLGPYKIEGILGAGGMGKVYKARDTRLGRTVAIKISNRRFGEFFEREARVISSLNHPNIYTLYDVGPNYLVMELVEGETLSERIKRGPIPLAEALRISKQVAGALEAAHENGIIHRDLKPANIKIRPDGSVKVLDFGLAKAVGQDAAVTADSPTVLSVPGVIIGTAGYMSPEQARGQKVDKRADIWAFAVVLYEMVSGQKPFERATVSDTLAAVISEDPDLTRVPARLQRVLQLCFQKDPNQRLRDVSGAVLLLDSEAMSAAPPPPRFSKVGWIAAVALAVTLTAGIWGWLQQKPTALPLLRLDLDLGAEVSLPAPRDVGSSVVISPDGMRLVFASGTPVKLFTRRLDQPKTTELPGTEGASAPFFSPDGKWVGFSSAGKLNRISVEGGPVVHVGDIPSLYVGGSWVEGDNIILGDSLKGLLRIPARGGRLETLASLGKGEPLFTGPRMLSDKAILFTGFTLGIDNETVEVLTLADRRRNVLVRGATSPHYLPLSSDTGYLLYVKRAALFAVPFNPNKLELLGYAVPILDDVAYQSTSGIGQFDVSRNGTLVYRKAGGGASATMTTLQWVDPNGKKKSVRDKADDYGSPSISPDGKQVAMEVTKTGSTDIWVYDTQRDTMTRLTFGGTNYRFPLWSPDGQHVVFQHLATGGIFQARADGAGQARVLVQNTKNAGAQIPGSFTSDGRQLAYVQLGGQNLQIWTVPIERQGDQLKAAKPAKFLDSAFNETSPSFSPDGRWLAYESDESGNHEVYVRAFPPPSSGQGAKWEISNNGGTSTLLKVVRWSRGEHELMYQSGDQIMAVSYTAKPGSFVSARPRTLIGKLGGTDWDVAPDGRLAVLVPALQPEHEVVLLVNFFDELRRKVPVGKYNLTHLLSSLEGPRVSR